MFKRKANEEAEETSKEIVDVIPRKLTRTSSHTFHFTQRRWITFEPNKVYYPLICQTPKYMFDEESINQINKFKPIFEAFSISKPCVRMTNLTCIQDQLGVAASTPTESQAYTQINYIVEFEPHGVFNYFKLGACDAGDPKFAEITSASYQFKQDDPRNPFVELSMPKDFESIEDLAIIPARANLYGGFIPSQAPKADPNTGKISSPYIAPNIYPNALYIVSGNLNPADDATNYIPLKQTFNKVTNRDKLKNYRRGDEIEFCINTNLDDVKMAAVKENIFLDDYQVSFPNPSSPKQTISYDTEWCYPSRNRPFLCRKNYYDTNTNPVTDGKDFAPLTHRFFCVAPIRDQSKKILKQRINMEVETKMSMTIYFGSNVFSTDVETNQDQLLQDDKVILRRNFYPIPTIETPPTPKPSLDEASVFCKKGNAACKIGFLKDMGIDINADVDMDQPCFDNTFEGLIEFLSTSVSNDEFMKLIEFKDKRPGPCPSDLKRTTFIDNNVVLSKTGKFQELWQRWIEQKNYTWFCIEIQKPKVTAREVIYWEVNGKPLVALPYEGPDHIKTYFHIHKERFLELFWAKARTTCINEDPVSVEEVNDSFKFDLKTPTECKAPKNPDCKAFFV